MSVFLSPQTGIKDDIISKCYLRFECRDLQPATDKKRQLARSQYRVRNNFVTGLDMHRSRLSAPPAEGRAELLEDDWKVLLPE